MTVRVPCARSRQGLERRNPGASRYTVAFAEMLRNENSTRLNRLRFLAIQCFDLRGILDPTGYQIQLLLESARVVAAAVDYAHDEIRDADLQERAPKPGILDRANCAEISMNFVARLGVRSKSMSSEYRGLPWKSRRFTPPLRRNGGSPVAGSRYSLGKCMSNPVEGFANLESVSSICVVYNSCYPRGVFTHAHYGISVYC